MRLVAVTIPCNPQIDLSSHHSRKTLIPDLTLKMAEVSAKTGEKKTVVLVTGGSGLVGKAIESIILEECNDKETWIFASSKDGDLRSKDQTIAMFEKYKPTHCIHVSTLVSKLPSILFLIINLRMLHILYHSISKSNYDLSLSVGRHGWWFI